MPAEPADLPNHVQAAVAAIADLHVEHYQKADRTQRLVSLTTSFLARTLGFLTAAIAGWIVLNLSLLVSGARVLDAPPFPYLADAASIIALYLTTNILITQRHDDDLATRRDQLTLELAILAEQKSTKIIGLLEALRQRDQDLPEQSAQDAGGSSGPTHPQAMLDALQAAHQALDDGEAGSDA